MTIPEQVNDLISQRRPEPLCDDCIADALGLRSHQQAYQAASALGTTSDFLRAPGVCADCGRAKTVTRRT